MSKFWTLQEHLTTKKEFYKPNWPLIKKFSKKLRTNVLVMPCYLWVEVSNTTIYTQNKVSHKVIEKMTPNEAFKRKKPNVGHFRIFGSLAYCHIPGDTCTKLDQTIERGYFVGTVRLWRHIGFSFQGLKDLLSDMMSSSWRTRHSGDPEICQQMIRVTSQKKSPRLSQG